MFEPMIESAKQVGTLTERNRIASEIMLQKGQYIDKLSLLEFILTPFLFPTIESESEIN
jgi:hypothetical protein